MPTLQTIRDFDPTGKRVLLRVDFNVPQNEQGMITDDSRMTKALPTIKYLLEKGAKLIIMSHLGRPDGEVKENMRLTPIAKHLEELLGKPVKKLDETIGENVKQEVEKLQNGEMLMLENTRFYPGEEANDPEFIKQLADLGEVFVNDGFGVSHRAHASSTGLASVLPAYAGFLIEKEMNALQPLMANPKQPFTVILGGAKIKDKIGMIDQFIGKAQNILIGGGLANTFIGALDHEVGQSLCEKDKYDLAKELLGKATSPEQIILPTDVVTAKEISNTASIETVAINTVPTDTKILDIGPQTIEAFKKIIATSATILWNGPLGLTEFTPFQSGTRAVAQAVADAKKSTGTFSVLGGGDTAEVLKTLGFHEEDFGHISTGGGASLEFLSGKKLPGIEVLYR